MVSAINRTFQQPLKLLQRNPLRGAVSVARPGGFLRLETLESQAETMAVQVQQPDLVTVTVDEYVERAAEPIESKRACSTSTDRPQLDLRKST